MDPDQALKELRAAFRDEDYDLADILFEGLDNWLKMGGAPPKSWTRKIRVSPARSRRTKR